MKERERLTSFAELLHGIHELLVQLLCPLSAHLPLHLATARPMIVRVIVVLHMHWPIIDLLSLPLVLHHKHVVAVHVIRVLSICMMNRFPKLDTSCIVVGHHHSLPFTHQSRLLPGYVLPYGP